MRDPSTRDLFRRWRRLALAGGAVLLLFVAYGPVLTRGPFGINDDYQYLYRVHEGTFDPAHNEQTGMGRPVAAWGLQVAYALCDGQVARLVWLRAFALVGIGLFAWTLFRTLVGLGDSRGFAGTVAALVMLSPAAGVYAAWAAALFSPYALTAALLAGTLLVGRAGWRREAAGGFLLVLACATWQAAAPLALFPTLAGAWRRTGRTVAAGGPRRWRPWLVCAGAVACYVAGSWLAVRLGRVPDAGTARLALATDLPVKVRLLGALLRDGATWWARLQPGFWEWTVGVSSAMLCLCALVVREAGRLHWPATCRRAGLALAMLLLSVAPLLAAREDNAAFRSLPVLYTVVAFLGVSGLHQLLRGRPAGLRAGLPLALVAASAGAARYHVWHGLVEPNLREYVGVRDQVRRQFPAGPPARFVYLVPPHTLLGEKWMTTSWEYGLVSSTFWWVTRPFLSLIFAETSPAGAGASPFTLSYREAGNPGLPVLDTLPALLRDPGVWRDDPRWGRVREFRGGWMYSPWFGYFKVSAFPYLQHHLLGTLIFTSQQKDGPDLWFYHEGLGQFHTDARSYPNLFVSRTGHWTLLSDSDPAHLLLHDAPDRETVAYPP